MAKRLSLGTNRLDTPRITTHYPRELPCYTSTILVVLTSRKRLLLASFAAPTVAGQSVSFLQHEVGNVALLSPPK